ncbi:MAG: benzoate MFS transporter BenK [uncultured Paraburkholderia sp.]|uniref:MFS transporter n=1 Tax=uncultured Paraburkholderia sp. TaxID=1822466 RepID=UPI0025971B05|nr:MFS transporter [uncultured Paraburkholderia sp.]CAH2903466.1 MAG: benzoate MFS transporter BenK [uncultured Paraburkholderia sp.]CAH2939981.1 MAG: benzoate MFS transporter BenK [uncultured Paraburkholderia sp.]
MNVNAGPRLDRLPMSGFHRRIMWLIGIGMFFDGFDIYVASTVLGATLKSGFSTLGQNALFVSLTFLGMMLGSLATGFLGDRFGRRFTYQANLAVFGLASLGAALAPNMSVLIACRFVMGLGLGAENVVGYSTLTEFVPPQKRGRLQGLMAVFVVSGLPVAGLIGLLLIPSFGWRAMFVLGGVGALGVWYARKSLPESPRWLDSVGRHDEADVILRRVEAEVTAERGGKPLPAPASTRPGATTQPALSFASLFSGAMLQRMIVGCVTLIVINTLLYGFVTWLPTFFVHQGFSIAKSFGFALVMSLGAPIGSAIGALTADAWGRKPTIIGSSLAAIVFGAMYPFITSPVILPIVGLLLTIPIYVLVALLFAVYVPELFPTEVRLRASGVCNTLGRGATIVTPFIVVSLFGQYGIVGVLAMMIGLLAVQIVVVAWLGVEPTGQRLEDLQPEDSLARDALHADAHASPNK